MKDKDAIRELVAQVKKSIGDPAATFTPQDELSASTDFSKLKGKTRSSLKKEPNRLAPQVCAIIESRAGLVAVTTK